MRHADAAAAKPVSLSKIKSTINGTLNATRVGELRSLGDILNMMSEESQLVRSWVSSAKALYVADKIASLNPGIDEDGSVQVAKDGLVKLLVGHRNQINEAVAKVLVDRMDENVTAALKDLGFESPQQAAAR